MSNHNVLRGKRVKRVAILLLTSATILGVSSCGSGNGTSSTTPPSNVQHRAFITNTYSGNLQIVDTQNDTSPLHGRDYEFRRSGRAGRARDYLSGWLALLRGIESR